MTNNPDTDVIAAFVDGEPIVPDRLRDALASPEGRDLLVDLLMLRDVVAADAVPLAPAAAVPAGRLLFWRTLAAAAVVTLAVGGGYLAGLRTGSRPEPTVVQAPHVETPPAPTVVVTVERWQDTRTGGGS
jgi:hypothetical protein